MNQHADELIFFLKNVFFYDFLINSGNLKPPANVKNIAPIEKILSPMWSWEFQLFIGTGLSFWRFVKVLVFDLLKFRMIFGWFFAKNSKFAKYIEKQRKNFYLFSPKIDFWKICAIFSNVISHSLLRSVRRRD